MATMAEIREYLGLPELTDELFVVDGGSPITISITTHDPNSDTVVDGGSGDDHKLHINNYNRAMEILK